MKMLRTILLFCAIAGLCACSSEQQTKAELKKQEYANSISNPQNNSKIYDVNTRMLNADETYTTYEILTGKEFQHGRLILRTDNNNRKGLYFYVMFETYQKNILKDTIIDLYVQTNKTHKVQKFSFVVNETSSLLREIVLGITGNDANKVDKTVLAWKIEVKNPEGKIITQEQSWLWSIDNPSTPEK